jgi:hypothetical protein
VAVEAMRLGLTLKELQQLLENHWHGLMQEEEKVN